MSTLLQLQSLFVKSHFHALVAEFLDFKLSFHIYLITRCRVIHRLANLTDKGY